MDWALAIEKNRVPLIGIVSALFALAGLSPDAAFRPLRLPKRLRFAILHILRPAESATRRLIVIAARRLKQPAPRQHTPVPDFTRFQKGGSGSLPAFRLVDPRKRFFSHPSRSIAKSAPRISVPGITPVAFQSPVIKARSEDEIDATQLAKRLVALKLALDDLPKQARRMTRYRAKMRDTSTGRIKLPPLRPGFPPGHRRRKRHEVDLVLTECDLLVRDLMRQCPT